MWTRADGSRLQLGDVATVVDGFAETDQYARFDVEPTVMVSVFRTGDQSALDIAAAARNYVDTAQTRLPQGVSLTIWKGSSRGSRRPAFTNAEEWCYRLYSGVCCPGAVF
ncbi:MAG: hypothetical protein CM1200mP25_5000 [Acidobacteriota bacterium]|nr:MAG: hypothetical protein CM1200mP25_5000 [Acidobacteriota bacterium]